MICCGTVFSSEREVFQAEGNNFGMWRLTCDPTIRDHANYHNTQCFSPDGRYVCYTHWSSGSKAASTVHLCDLHTDKSWQVSEGVFPRWARHHNWLFYVYYNPEKRSRGNLGTETIMLDVDQGRSRVIAAEPGAEALGETTFDDQWLIGAQRFRGQDPEFRVVRIQLPGGRVEHLPEVIGAQLLPNPRHPVFFTRRDHRADPFKATRFWYDLDGTNQRIAVPTLQQCHMSWLGDGQYMLLGNGLIRGRKWNEPFPSNVHILASVGVGDISPCGTSGRWVCGDSTLADLRSGDGWHIFEPLSQICYPARIGDNSGIYDADPKGSADGTKICFVSNYPLKDGPVTRIVEFDRERDRMTVESTVGFPSSGHLCLQREVVGYERKTSSSFEGLRRRSFDTAGANIRPGRTVTSFEARCLTDGQYSKLAEPNFQLVRSVGEQDSPLMRQRMTDVYVAVVRRPDRPHLRYGDSPRGDEVARRNTTTHSLVELIPGENHAETFGYHLECNGRRITDEPLRPGATLQLVPAGQYRAVAVEWSKLESGPSLPLEITQPIQLTVLTQKPDDFSWTTERWRDNEQTVSETVHLLDGVIRRQWFDHGVITRRHDLNDEAMAIRREQFEHGKLAQREYHNRDGHLVSRELFDAEGFITEWIQLDTDGNESTVRDHWYFDRGMPVRHQRGGAEYVKIGDRWGAFEGGRFVDLPRGPYSR